MRDQTLKSKLNTLIQRINENVQSLKFDRDHEFFVTETVIITSLYKNFTDVQYNDSLLSSIPKLISEKKETYEAIFSLLKTHP